MEIRLYFQMLKRGWWVILLTALTALVGALAASYVVRPKYKAVARFIVTPSSVFPNSPDLLLYGYEILINQTLITTYAEVMKSNLVYTDALGTLGLDADFVERYYTYEVNVLPNSAVLELTVLGPDPGMVTNIANEIGTQTINFAALSSQFFKIDFLDTAVPPDKPESPRPLQDSLLALGLGLIVGSVLAILREQLLISVESIRDRLNLDNETGVYSGRYFSRLLEDELSQRPDEILSIGIVELSGLRDLDDALPLASIQRILREATEILRRELRGHDVIGRWDDSSFVVMLPRTPGDAASRIFDRIFHSLSQPLRLGQLELPIVLAPCIGGAEYSTDISFQELLEKAEYALENARRDKVKPVYVWEIKNPFWSKEEIVEE
jgi:diguanylate cyclase (GGDEF)-like protein